MSEPAGLRHQWWCPSYGVAGDGCTCLPAWLLYERTRLAGMVVPRPLPVDVVEGPPCLACGGKAEQTTGDGLRVPCAPGDGTRHAACVGNGGGRMSPAASFAWRAAHPVPVVDA
jgi:hypothetical protein